jgi:methyl-galactoside transport system substrate-binding protein
MNVDYPRQHEKGEIYEKILVSILVALIVISSVFAGGKQDAAASKIVIGALIRNLDEQFLADYTANLKDLAARPMWN